MSKKVEKSYLQAKKKISLENVRFTYPNKKEPALDGLSVEIPINSVIGIVGPSGSGKSTLIDILLGLIEPDQGKLKIDNKIIDSKNRRSWQNTIGSVSYTHLTLPTKA